MAKATKKTTAQATDVLEVKEQDNPTVEYMTVNDVNFLPLTSLIPLDTLPIENAKLAMRELNKQHVENLTAALNAGDVFPPLKVVATNYGVTPYDGNHRWAAYEIFLKQRVGETTPDKLQAERENMMIPVVFDNSITNDIQLLNASFSANLAHGLPATPTSRARYGLWLVELAKSRGEKLSLRQAAAQAKVSHVALIHMRDNLAKKDARMVDAFADEVGPAQLPDEETEAAQKQATKHDKAMMAIVKAVKAANELREAFPDYNDLNDFLTGYAGEAYQEDVKPAIELLQHYWRVTTSKPIVPDEVQQPALVD